MKGFLSALGFLLITTTAAPSQGWQMDRSHTSVTFTVKHMVISEVTGKFTDFNVTLSSSKDDFSDAAFDGTIKVASINTDNDRRDNHLKSDDFFNADSFPEITFKSTSFEKVGESKYKIAGDLTIRNVTKKVSWDATLMGVLKTSRGTIAAWKASLVINRFDYNLKWNRTIETGGLIVGQDVTITIVSEFHKQAS